LRLCRFQEKGIAFGGVVVEGRVVSLGTVNRMLRADFPLTLDELVQQERLVELRARLPEIPAEGPPLDEVRLLAPLVRPPKIWCIGLNYVEHASDLSEKSPEEPASFMRPAYSIVGPGETIRLPEGSERVTGEAELAIVIGRKCRDISEQEAENVIGAFVPAIDITAEDILRRNPRFLTRAKSFDTFLSLGPFLVTPDDIGGRERVFKIKTATRLNGVVERENVVAHMRHDPYALISFHSRGMTWLAGDVLLTGTPGAAVLSSGDVVGAEVEGVGLLENPVLRESR
jgi:2-keto-4-pentenoate hydratase/2-oxohepta-3-ene-1,7-dioic acid hydratase in catechol pathway